MRHLATILPIVAGLATVAGAQINLYLENTQDVALLCDSVNNPSFYIGSNPDVIALVGDNLFIAGHNGGAAPSCKMVKIETIFGTRAFRNVPDSAAAVPAGRGFYGLQYDYGPARSGLVLSYDAGAIGRAGAFKLYDVDTQLNPILLKASPAGTSPRGGAGPAFDYGHDGLGFDLNGDGTPDGPVLAVLDFSGYPGDVQSKGPFGIRIRDGASSNGLDVINGRIYDSSSVDGMGNPIAPIINTPGSNGVALSGTLWRDISIDYTNGNFAARADNDLVIGRRNANNGTLNHAVVSCSSFGGCESIAFQIMQRCEILTGLTGGDVVVYNQYLTSGPPSVGSIKAVDLDGQPKTVNFFNPDGTTFTQLSTSGVMDFSWDPDHGRLAVSDFISRTVFIFTTTPPGPVCAACAADYNQDGGITGDDVSAFFADFESSAPCADVNQDGGITGDDVGAFFGVFEAGGC